MTHDIQLNCDLGKLASLGLVAFDAEADRGVNDLTYAKVPIFYAGPLGQGLMANGYDTSIVNPVGRFFYVRSTSIFHGIDAMIRPCTFLAALALCLLASPGRGATDDVNARLTEAAAAIDQALEHSSMPGLVVGITDRHTLRKVIVHGYADLKTRKPLTADSRFAIGSISKAFTAIALMQLSQEHRFDPHAPITRYLPSLVVHSRFAPITGHDLLSHTSGLPDYLPDSASSRYAAIELKDFEPSYAPGAHWWYSNTGFQLLGYVLENIEHEPYTKIVRRRVLDPIGMASTSAIIDDAERERMVVSYVRWPYDGSFVEAPWFEYSAGDGSIVANVADMSAYVRFILNRGAGTRVGCCPRARSRPLRLPSWRTTPTACGFGRRTAARSSVTREASVVSMPRSRPTWRMALASYSCAMPGSTRI